MKTIVDLVRLSRYSNARNTRCKSLRIEGDVIGIRRGDKQHMVGLCKEVRLG